MTIFVPQKVVEPKPTMEQKKKVPADAETFFLVAGVGFEPTTSWL